MAHTAPRRERKTGTRKVEHLCHLSIHFNFFKASPGCLSLSEEVELKRCNWSFRQKEAGGGSVGEYTVETDRSIVEQGYGLREN